ncbi:MAG: hypothetical protein HZB38_06080 [Planctomycetes bacterium]|nr:hypothetical protein [Planctomycetota bacterium]
MDRLVCAVAGVAMFLGLCAGTAAGQASRPAELTVDELKQMAKEVEADVAKLRGWEFKRPVKTDVRDEKQLREFIEKRLFEEELGGGRLEQTQAFLRMVGIIPADCDMRKTMIDVLLNQVGGFYDPPTQAFYMLKRGGVAYGPLVNRILIAHELTHALDDQYFDLDKLMKSREQSEDWSLAVGSLVEGSATQLMTAYTLRAMSGGKYDTSELAQVAKDEMARSRSFIEAPPYFRTLAATYLCGMSFVVRGRMTDFPDASAKAIRNDLLAAAKDPPVSSEQILHPDKYWNKRDRDEPVRFDDAAIEKLLADGTHLVVHRNTAGEILCAVATNDHDEPFNMAAGANPTYWTNEAATGWGGDRFYLLAAGATPEAAKELRDLRGVWITAWDTKSDRDEFVEDYEARRPNARRSHWKVGDRAAVFAIGFEPEEATVLQSKLNAEALRAAKDGKPWTP